MGLLALVAVGLLIFFIFMYIILPKLIFKGENKLKNKIGEKKNARESCEPQRLADRFSEITTNSSTIPSTIPVNQNNIKSEKLNFQKNLSAEPVSEITLEELETAANSSVKKEIIQPTAATDMVEFYSVPTGSGGTCSHCKKATDEIYSITLIKGEKVQSTFVCETCCEKLKKYVNKVNNK